ncbi:hypothetical protein K523DRAFT_329638 [Schizophyllum commune Tattone D]|nr:hypothetical protein K523DRAFT_329638 [Schizophyllum commune Tattone D]
MSTAENDEIYEGLCMLFNEDCLSGLLSDETYKLEEIAEEPEDVTVIPDEVFHPRNYLPFWTDPPPYEGTTEASPSAVLAPHAAIPSASSATPTSRPNPEAHPALQTPQPSPPPLPTDQAQFPAPQELAQPSTVQQEQHVNMGIGSTPSNPSTPLSTHLNAPISLPSTTVPAAIADTDAMPSAFAGAPLSAANTDAPITLHNINSPAAFPITNNMPAAAPDANEALLRALYAAQQWYPTPPNSSRVPTPPGPQQMAAYPLFSPYAHIQAYALVPYHAQIPTYAPYPPYVHHPAYAPMLPYALMTAYAPYPMQVPAPAPQGPMQLPNAPPAQTYYATSSAPMGGAAAPTNIAPLSNGATAEPTSGAAAPTSGTAPTSGLPSRHYRPHVYEAARAERAAQAAQPLEAPQPVQAEVSHIAQLNQGVQTARAAQVSQAAQSAEIAQTAHAAQTSQPAHSAQVSQVAHVAQDSQPAHSEQVSQPDQATRVLSVQVAQTAQPSPQVLHAGLPALKRKRDESEAKQDNARDAAGRQGERDVTQRQPCRWKHGREPCTRFFYPQNFQTPKEFTEDVLTHLERVVVIPKDTSADPQKNQKTRVACGWELCARDFATLEAVAQHVALRHILGIPSRTSKKAKTSH